MSVDKEDFKQNVSYLKSDSVEVKLSFKNQQ